MTTAMLYADTFVQARPAAALDAALENIERQLAALGIAMRDHDAAAIEGHAAELRRALAVVSQRVDHSARLPEAPLLRERLARAAGQVAAQRESLARAGAALERAIEVLMPEPLPTATYGQAGHSKRAASSGCLHA